MNIPALIGIDFSEDVNGKMGIVDGYTGKLYIEPDEETMKKYEAKKAEDENKKRLLLELKGKENVTLDGKKINLYANIGGGGGGGCGKCTEQRCGRNRIVPKRVPLSGIGGLSDRGSAVCRL